MSRTMLATFLLIALAACDAEPDREAALADSLGQDLELAPVDTTAQLGDEPAETPAPQAAAPEPERTRPTPSRTEPEPEPEPEEEAPAPPRESAARSLASGASFEATTDTQISSGENEVGDEVTATVASAVRDSRGRVVIPAGSQVTLRITAIHESENKSDTTGTLTLEPQSVLINGESYPVQATISDLDYDLVDRGTNVGDVAKVGGGAAAGAVVGRVLGGGSKGAIIGGIIGGAVGAQRAVETQDRDVVVPESTTITLTLTDELEVARQ